MVAIHPFGLVWSTVAFVGIVYGQVQSVPYCDPLTTICYSSYTSTLGISFRIALPDVATAPSDAIIQIVAPISIGWAAFAWGGTMTWNPLTMGWANGLGAMVSSRLAYGLSQPGPYTGAEYTYLRGTGSNATHWTMTARCRGCMSWTGSDGSIASLNYTGTSNVAFAQTKRPVVDPTSNTTRFNYHDSFGKWQHDIGAARSPLFETWILANIVVGNSSSTASSISTSAPSTTLATSTLSPTTAPTTSSASSVATQTGHSVPTSCAGVPSTQYPGITAPGWTATKVKGDMTSPRTVIFDKAGNLLIVESGLGITAHTIDSSGCITSSKTLITQNNLSHGLVLDGNGTILYASSMTSVWSWTYSSATQTVGNSTVVISGMYNMGHVSRTLALSPAHPNLLLVSHGSGDNFDYPAGDMTTQRAVIKVFDLSTVPAGGYQFVTDGYQAGWGLRNEVGLTFDGNNMLWGVENSADELTRTANNITTDIHTDNPADELNYLGDISIPNTKWYGYPTCHTVCKPSAIADRNFSIGDQFVLAPNETYTDDTCRAESQPARLAFQAHSGPLDAKFNAIFSTLYVTFHGSWNRDPPTGYKVVAIPFEQAADGSFTPTAPANSSSGYEDVWTNRDVTQCGATACFRPVGIAVDAFDRMYVTSDASAEGELWLLGKI